MTTPKTSLLYTPLDKNISTNECEGYQCIKKATNQIIVNAGVFGNVSLNLCSQCVTKFNGQLEENNMNVGDANKYVLTPV